MEQYGLYYYFTHADGEHTLVMADDPNSHTALTNAIPFHTEETDYRRVDDHVCQWSSDLQLHSGAFTFRDYNFTTPSADLTAKRTIRRAIVTTAMRSTTIPAPMRSPATGRSWRRAHAGDRGPAQDPERHQQRRGLYCRLQVHAVAALPTTNRTANTW